MQRPVQHIDGKFYLREWKPGRKSLPREIKSKNKTISLSPYYHSQACQWKQITGMDFSSWIEDKMFEELKCVSNLVKP